jgi:hypothetical protein
VQRTVPADVGAGAVADGELWTLVEQLRHQNEQLLAENKSLVAAMALLERRADDGNALQARLHLPPHKLSCCCQLRAHGYACIVCGTAPGGAQRG